MGHYAMNILYDLIIFCETDNFYLKITFLGFYFKEFNEILKKTKYESKTINVVIINISIKAYTSLFFPN